MMWRGNVTPVDHRVPHGFISVIDADFRSDTPSEAFLCTLLHLFKDRQVLFDRLVSVL